VIGFFFWGFVLFLITPGLDNMILMVVLALASAAVGGVARFTFWWVDSLPEQVLGAFGLTLTIIGTVLSLAEPLSKLL
jgi:hypothetical protein